MFNNTYNRNENPPNYYPNDNAFYNEINSNNNTNNNNFNLEKLLPIINGNSNPMDLIKNFTSSNPQLGQIFGLLNSMQKTTKKQKKTTTLKSDCNYTLVKDYYSNKNNLKDE